MVENAHRRPCASGVNQISEAVGVRSEHEKAVYAITSRRLTLFHGLRFRVSVSNFYRFLDMLAEFYPHSRAQSIARKYQFCELFP
jgi:hypothetical protein